LSEGSSTSTVAESPVVVVEAKPVVRALEPELGRGRESGRIAEVDALRGIAAIAVVLYHYTQRYGELGVAFPGQYPAVGAPWFRVPWGHFGVQLFFMISGFVILMTVMKVRSVKEFALLRFARLYPAFWTACVLTFGAVHLFGLTSRAVSWGAGVKNLSMVPAMLKAWYIDPVYWTLQQEMMFYVVMGVMLAAGARRHAMTAVAVLVALSLCGVGQISFHTTAGSPEHPIVDLKWFSLFLAGMVLYDARERVRWWHGGLLLLCAADVLRHNVWAPDNTYADWGSVWADLICFAALAVATRWRVPLLGNRVLVYLGTISYCLYLVHQNIGYVVIRELSSRGVVMNVAIAGAIGVAVGVASAVTFGVERPVCAWARRVVKRRRAVQGAAG
jgi:peptidoglycan/LPS O-acetylase OafA/YrhL